MRQLRLITETHLQVRAGKVTVRVHGEVNLRPTERLRGVPTPSPASPVAGGHPGHVFRGARALRTKRRFLCCLSGQEISELFLKHF